MWWKKIDPANYASPVDPWGAIEFLHHCILFIIDDLQPRRLKPPVNRLHTNIGNWSWFQLPAYSWYGPTLNAIYGLPGDSWSLVVTNNHWKKGSREFTIPKSSSAEYARQSHLFNLFQANRHMLTILFWGFVGVRVVCDLQKNPPSWFVTKLATMRIGMRAAVNNYHVYLY